VRLLHIVIVIGVTVVDYVKVLSQYTVGRLSRKSANLPY